MGWFCRIPPHTYSKIQFRDRGLESSSLRKDLGRYERGWCPVFDPSSSERGSCGVAQEGLQEGPEQRRRRWVDGCALERLERQRGHASNHPGQRVSEVGGSSHAHKIMLCIAQRSCCSAWRPLGLSACCIQHLLVQFSDQWKFPRNGGCPI